VTDLGRALDSMNWDDSREWRARGLTFELSGPEPAWCLAREALRLSMHLAGQAPCRWRSARAKG